MVDAQSFVIRIWSEGHGEDGRPIPRGHITHVLDERRIPVTTFEDIVGFIEGYLNDMDDSERGGSSG